MNGEATVTSTTERESPPGLSDRQVTVVLFLLMAAVCAVSFWLVMRAAIPGAPGAPVG